MRWSLKTHQFIERGIAVLGRYTAWLSFLMMLGVVAIIILRDGFKLNSIVLQESTLYAHAMLIVFGAAYTLQNDDHVRVDAFYQHFSARTKAWVNSLGIICFLIPFCVFIFFNSMDFVSTSWSLRETSSESGGLPFVYLLKTLIPLLALSLFLQSLASLYQHIYLLTTGEVLVTQHH